MVRFWKYTTEKSIYTESFFLMLTVLLGKGSKQVLGTDRCVDADIEVLEIKKFQKFYTSNKKI